MDDVSVTLIPSSSSSVEFVTIVSLPVNVAFPSPTSTSVSSLSIVAFIEVSPIVSDAVVDTAQHNPSACFTVIQVLLSLSLSDTASFN